MRVRTLARHVGVALGLLLQRRRIRLLGLALLFSTLVLCVLDRLFPLPLPPQEAGLVVISRDGTPLRSWPSVDGVWRYPITETDVSPHYLEAVLTYEDRWFRWHPGVNPVALVRATWQWARHGRIVSGGSTLTMQVARMLDPPPRTVAGKLQQILRALQLEAHLSKREILVLYLSQAPMGGIVEGVEMASRAYLGKPSRHLSRAEAAMLAALPQAPSRLRPDRAPERAQRARDKVLDRMVAFGVWSVADVADAKVEKVGAEALRAHWLAPLAAERLRQEARRAVKPVRGTDSRLAVVRSTLDVEIQSTLERMLLDRVEQLPKHVSIAAIVMDNVSLEVRGYAGSADFSDARRFSHVDMVRGVRSPGSTLKPFLYAQALDEGLIHSESLLSDAPQSFSGYEPGNFQAAFSGPVSAAEALQRSLNVPAVDLLDRIGPARFSARLRAGGLKLRMAPGATPNLSLILGGAGTTLEELVGAYRALATGGLAGLPRLSPDVPRVERRIMSEGAAFIVRDILESGGHPDRPFLESGPRVAWKTGTSFGFRDAWAVGVTDGYTIGVWVGRPDGTPNPGFFGANIAAPLLKDFAAALPGANTGHARWPPPSVAAVSICWPLGLAAEVTPVDQCFEQRRAWSLGGAVPPTLSDRLRLGSLVETIWIDPVTGMRTMPGCSTAAQSRQIARWPAMLEPWVTEAAMRRQGLPAWSPDCRKPLPTAGELRLDGIAEGAVVRPAPGLANAQLTVRVIGSRETLYWLLDGRFLRASLGSAPQRIDLSEDGMHMLTAMDARGRHVSARFVLKGFGAARLEQ